MRYLRSGTRRWLGRWMCDWLGLHAEREGLLGGLMRLTRCDNVRIVVTRLSGSVGRIVSSNRYICQSQLMTFSRGRLYRCFDRVHVSLIALIFVCNLYRLKMNYSDLMVY